MPEKRSFRFLFKTETHRLLRLIVQQKSVHCVSTPSIRLKLTIPQLFLLLFFLTSLKWSSIEWTTKWSRSTSPLPSRGLVAFSRSRGIGDDLWKWTVQRLRRTLRVGVVTGHHRPIRRHPHGAARTSTTAEQVKIATRSLVIRSEVVERVLWG